MNSSYVAPGYVWMFTPSTPTRAIWNTASSAHSAEANDWATPLSTPHEIVFISSIRSGIPCKRAVLIDGMTLLASVADDRVDRRLAIVG